MSETSTKLRISVSRKNKQTDEYEQDFSGFVVCYGTAAASKAAALSQGDRIKIGDCDVSTKYDAAKKVTYTNFKLFSFEKADGESKGSASQAQGSRPKPAVDEGEVEADLPF